MPQHTGQGNQNRTDDGRTGLYGSYHMGQDQYGVTEHLDRKGGETGDSTLGAPALKRGCGIPTRDKFDAGHSHPAWQGVRCLGNIGGDL